MKARGNKRGQSFVWYKSDLWGSYDLLRRKKEGTATYCVCEFISLKQGTQDAPGKKPQQNIDTTQINPLITLSFHEQRVESYNTMVLKSDPLNDKKSKIPLGNYRRVQRGMVSSAHTVLFRTFMESFVVFAQAWLDRELSSVRTNATYEHTLCKTCIVFEHTWVCTRYKSSLALATIRTRSCDAATRVMCCIRADIRIDTKFTHQKQNNLMAHTINITAC